LHTPLVNIIHAICIDLNIVRDILIQRLGPDFSRSAAGNQDNYVSPRVSRPISFSTDPSSGYLQVVQILSTPPPSATNIDDYLANIAATYGVKWRPEPHPQDMFADLQIFHMKTYLAYLLFYYRLNTISELLDPEASPVIDLPLLRKLCSQGTLMVSTCSRTHCKLSRYSL